MGGPEEAAATRATPAGNTAQITLTEPIAAGWILRRRAPRVVRDALGPLASFFVVWKLIGLIPGIAAATVYALVIYRWERRHGRPGMIVRVALTLVFLRATVGLVTGSANAYLGQEVIIDVLIGLAVLVSLALDRPVAEIFAKEIYPFPSEARQSLTYRRALRVITAVWGSYFLVRAAVRLVAFLALTVDQYVIVLAVSDVPFLIGLLVWSVLYTIRTFRTSDEWGAAIATAERARSAVES
jgi:intracellular septation protein A